MIGTVRVIFAPVESRADETIEVLSDNLDNSVILQRIMQIIVIAVRRFSNKLVVFGM